MDSKSPLHHRLARLRRVQSSRKEEWSRYNDLLDCLKEDLALAPAKADKFCLLQRITELQSDINHVEQILHETEMQIAAVEDELQNISALGAEIKNYGVEPSVHAENVALTQYYYTRGPLFTDNPTYVERQADKELFEKLMAGELCCVFNSRQTGKSSLRVRVKRKLQSQGVKCVDIAATEIIASEDMPPEKWYLGVIESIVTDLGLAENGFKAVTWWKEFQELSEVKRFQKFIREILLEQVKTQKIVIFIDEIDRFLSLRFKLDGFFAVIREFHNKRADTENYRRLTFALIGVATPPDLMRHPYSTPFNTGCNIELGGFEFQDVEPLSRGLVGRADNVSSILHEILYWTGGQPFLTQKLCGLVVESDACIPFGKEKEFVEALVEKNIICNWEAKDDPQHLKPIENRLLANEARAGRILELYKMVLGGENIDFSDSDDEMHLRLSGLVLKSSQDNRLKVYNRIYARIFNLEWIENVLSKIIRPYAHEIERWKTSNCKDQRSLLYGEKLRQMQAWFDQAVLSLGKQDFSFFAASRELDEKANFIVDLKERELTLNTVMEWTNGQIELNKAILSLLSKESSIQKKPSRDRINKVINSKIVKQWKSAADTERIRQVRDKFLEYNQSDPFWALDLYRSLLSNETVTSNNEREEEKYLVDLGIIFLRHDDTLNLATLAVTQIYAKVFDIHWTKKELLALRPYAEKLVRWVASGCTNNSFLLTRDERQAALEWRKHNNFNPRSMDSREQRFFMRSRIVKG